MCTSIFVFNLQHKNQSPHKKYHLKHPVARRIVHLTAKYHNCRTFATTALPSQVRQMETENCSTFVSTHSVKTSLFYQFKKLFVLFYVYGYSAYITCTKYWRGQKGVSYPLELVVQYRWLWAALGVLGIEQPWSSGRIYISEASLQP